VKLVLAALSLAMIAPQLQGVPKSSWVLIRSSHFELYSHSGEREARAALLWLERLRAFFIQAGVEQAGANLESHGPLRVVAFESEKEYDRFRTNPSADAYFLSTEIRDYLVLPELRPEEYTVVAHEYAHLVVNSFGVRLPPWLREGIAEFFSTVRMHGQEWCIGGDLPNRVFALKQSAWIALPALLSATSSMQADRQQTSVFYAESWALTDMLIFSPDYGSRFSQLLSAMATETAEPGTLAHLYSKPLSRIWRDLKGWIQTSRSPVPLPAVPNVSEHVEAALLSDVEAQAMEADLLLASGNLVEAETAYRTLSAQKPNEAFVHAALGNIALRKGDREAARHEWKRAMQLGITDAGLCYQYALLGEEARLPTEEIRAALDRAIALKAEFDDARYRLALLESNSGNYEEALKQFRSIGRVPAARAYAYWLGVASALNETGQRILAKQAAQKALSYDAGSEQRASALRLAYMADTDFAVQFSRDANGTLQMVTARKPHGSDDWNPFIEPGDTIRHFEGQIRKVECESGSITGFRVEDFSSSVEVLLPDPTHVLIRGGSPEFVCGAEDGRAVAIDYAASHDRPPSDGILRGMLFR
jgi:hypothetical protein